MPLIFHEFSVAATEGARERHTVRLAIDTNATLCLLPARLMHDMGVTPKEELADVTYANGLKDKLPVGTVWFRINGREVACRTAFGADDAEPILCTHALDAANAWFGPDGDIFDRGPDKISLFWETPRSKAA